MHRNILGVEIDIKLKKMYENFKERAKKVETKIFLSVSKTFLISQLGYLLSMLDCPKELIETMQLNKDKFVTRAKPSWIS